VSGDSDRLAALVGAALLEAVDRAVAKRLPELLAANAATAPEGFIGTGEAARRAGVKADTVLEWITRGALPATRPPGTKQWRLRPSELDAFIAGQSAGTASHPSPLSLDAKRAERARALAEAARGKGDA
jgi:excisionase family DNA binding protein